MSLCHQRIIMDNKIEKGDVNITETLIFHSDAFLHISFCWKYLLLFKQKLEKNLTVCYLEQPCNILYRHGRLFVFFVFFLIFIMDNMDFEKKDTKI